MEIFNIVWRNCKWRFQNPATIVMNVVQPIIWLLLFSTIFQPVSGSDVNYTTFIFPGLLIMSVLTSAGISCGIANYSIKSDGSFYRIYISPIKRSSIVLGQILDVEILSFIGVGILLLLSIPFSITISSGFIGIILIIFILFLCVFFVASFSYIMSFVLPDENAFIGLMNTITLPLFFVSTALMPAEQLPAFFQVAAKINPFSYVINCIRGLILTKSVVWKDILLVSVLLITLGTLCFKFAVHMLNKEEK